MKNKNFVNRLKYWKEMKNLLKANKMFAFFNINKNI